MGAWGHFWAVRGGARQVGRWFMRRHGLTWVEVVLAVLVLVVVLIAVLLPSLGRAREGSHRSCWTNLRVQGSAFFAYTAIYGGNWAPSTARLTSLCQQTLETRDAFLYEPTSRGADTTRMQKCFYCPRNLAQDPAKLWEAGGVSTWGYVWLNDRGAGAGLPTTFPARSVPLEYVSDVGKVQRPAETVLALDVVVTDTDAAPLNFTPKGVDFGSSHVSAGRPFQVNVLFADEHVESLKFDEKTAVAVRQPGGGYFWIPGP